MAIPCSRHCVACPGKEHASGARAPPRCWRPPHTAAFDVGAHAIQAVARSRGGVEGHADARQRLSDGGQRGEIVCGVCALRNRVVAAQRICERGRGGAICSSALSTMNARAAGLDAERMSEAAGPTPAALTQRIVGKHANDMHALQGRDLERECALQRRAGRAVGVTRPPAGRQRMDGTPCKLSGGPLSVPDIVHAITRSPARS